VPVEDQRVVDSRRFAEIIKKASQESVSRTDSGPSNAFWLAATICPPWKIRVPVSLLDEW
jgi:hypothetical protein